MTDAETRQPGARLYMHHIARIYASILGVLAFLIILLLFSWWLSWSEDMPAGSAPVIEILIQTGVILTIFLAWRKELTGGLILIFGGAGVGVLFYIKAYADNLMWSVAFAAPIIVSGILFVISHFSRGPELPAEIPEAS